MAIQGIFKKKLTKNTVQKLGISKIKSNLQIWHT